MMQVGKLFDASKISWYKLIGVFLFRQTLMPVTSTECATNASHSMTPAALYESRYLGWLRDSHGNGGLRALQLI